MSTPPGGTYAAPPQKLHPLALNWRVPIETLFDCLQGGETLEEFLEGFPAVSRESAVAALQEAKLLLLARP